MGVDEELAFIFSLKLMWNLCQIKDVSYRKVEFGDGEVAGVVIQ